MVSLSWKLALILVALFTGAAAVIRALPVDDQPTRAVLTAGGCAHPCFLGIQPGVTPDEQAISLLGTHPWVKRIDRYAWFSEPGTSLFSWEWSGAQPDWINARIPGALSTRHFIVDWVKVPTTVPFGDWWRLLRQPQTGLVNYGVNDQRASYTAVYRDGGLAIRAFGDCPVPPAAFWTRWADLELRAATRSLPVAAFDSSVWLRQARCGG